MAGIFAGYMRSSHRLLGYESNEAEVRKFGSITAEEADNYYRSNVQNGELIGMLPKITKD